MRAPPPSVAKAPTKQDFWSQKYWPRERKQAELFTPVPFGCGWGGWGFKENEACE